LADLTRHVVIVNELGLHARAAAKVAKLAGRSHAAVWVCRDNERADASSVVDILTLACPRGTPLTICVDDPDDVPILDAIAELVRNGFEE
jgi:phosphocarrier protein HPr